MKKTTLAVLTLILSMAFVLAIEYDVYFNKYDDVGTYIFGDDPSDVFNYTDGDIEFNMTDGDTQGYAHFEGLNDWVHIGTYNQPTNITYWDEDVLYVFNQPVIAYGKVDGDEFYEYVTLNYYVAEYSEIIALSFQTEDKYFNVWVDDVNIG